MPDFFGSVRELPFAVLDKLRSVGELVDRIERHAADLSQCILDCRTILRLQHEMASLAPPTFVYVLPPSTPMMAQWARVGRSSRQTLSFMAHHPIEENAWVVVVGPAIVRSVVLGNQFQSGMTDSQGQVCKIHEPWQPGVLLRVELEAA